MVQNQHDGGKIITHATVQGNTWSATVPAPGDYIVMFSALGHDCTSREFTVAVNDDQVKDAYLPPLFKNLDGTPSVHELPRAGLLVYSFLDKYINTEDDAPDDPPLNGVTWTIKFKKKDGTFGYVSGVTGTQPSITTLDGRVINDTAGYYYFTGLPPGEVIATSSASTAWQYDADGPLSLGPITDPVTRNPINFTSETRFYLVSTEEGGKAWDPKLYPGDPGTEAGVYLIWHGYIEKLDQVGTPTNPTPFNPLLVGSISGTLVDADAPNLDPDEPFPVPGKDHPGVELNDVVENGLVVLFRIGETVPVHPIATTETLADGSFSFVNVPPGEYKLFNTTTDLNYVWTQKRLVVLPKQHVVMPMNSLLVPRFFARCQGHVIDSTTNQPIEGARVHIRYKDGSIQDTRTTNAQGWYKFNALPEIEVLGHVDVELPAGYRGLIRQETYFPNGKLGNQKLGGPPFSTVTVTTDASGKHLQWYTANYNADLFLEQIPAAETNIGGYVFYDQLVRGTWDSDGIYQRTEERTLHGVTVELWNAAGTQLLATALTGKVDEAELESLGWTRPYSVPPDEFGGVYAGQKPGYYEFRKADYDGDPLTAPTPLRPGTYIVRLNRPLTPDPLHALFGFASVTPDSVTVSPVGGLGVEVNFGVNTTPVGSTFGVPLAGEIEGGIFDDLNIDPNPTSTLFMEKAGIAGVPVVVYDHLGYVLGVGYMGNPWCNPANAFRTPPDPWACPPGSDMNQKPEMERRFAPGVHIYVGNDPSQIGYNDAYLPLVLPYSFGQGKFKFEADWSLVPVSVFGLEGGGQPAWLGNLFLPDAPPAPQPPIINNVAPTGSFTIDGDNFGGTRGFSTVTLAGQELRVISWSNKQIHVEEPVIPMRGNILVTTTAGISNGYPVDAGDPPPHSLFVDCQASGISDGSKEHPFKTIGEALANLPETTPRYVFVRPGTYQEHVKIDASDVRLIGAGPHTTTIDGHSNVSVTSQGFANGGGPAVFFGGGGMEGSVERVMISGFRIKGGSVSGDKVGCGVFSDFGNRGVDINNCIIAHNGGYYGGGIWMHSSNHDVKIWSNVITENGNFGGYGGGISINDEPEYGEEHGQPEHVWDDHKPGCPPGRYEVFNNRIYRNFSVDYGGGMCFYEVKDHLIIAGNAVEENRSEDHGGGALFEDTGPIDLYGNEFIRNFCRDDGGAISFEDVGDDNALVLVHHNIFALNVADDCGENTARGGALAFDDTFYVEIYQNAIVDNICAGSHDPAGGGIDSERHGHEYNGSEPLGRYVHPGYSDMKIYDNVLWGNKILKYEQPLSAEDEDLCFTWGKNHVATPNDLHVDNPAVQDSWDGHLNSESFSLVQGNVISTGAYASRGNTSADPKFVDPANEDWSLAPNTPVPYLGAYANTAWLPAMPQISPLPSSEPKCIGSCFAINSAKVGIEAVEVEGLTMIEVTSMVGNQPRITRYVADINETDDDDDDEDDDQKLGDVTVVNDGVNGKVAINTSGKPMLTLYQSFGAYTVTKIGVLTDPDTKGNDVEIKGSFDPISPIVPSVDAVTCKLSDQTGHSVSVTIPPQSLVSSGRALKYKGLIDGIKVQVELKGKSFKLKLKGMGATSTLVGEDITFGLQIGVNIGEETIHMSRKESKLLKYKRKKKFACGK